MSKHEADGDRKGLPKPVAVTPAQLQQVAAGIAVSLPSGEDAAGQPGTLTGAVDRIPLGGSLVPASPW